MGTYEELAENVLNIIKEAEKDKKDEQKETKITEIEKETVIPREVCWIM